MKLLICTQSVDLDDPVLGFFHGWIKELSLQVESVEVICLRKGRYALPENVSVHSLGKEAGVGRLLRAFRFFRLIITLRARYDAVFAHMNPEYVVAGGALWRLLGKEIGLWYAHGAVTGKLRVATALAHHVFTSTPHGYRLRSEKVRVVGQGIDIRLFKPEPNVRPEESCALVSVSRISRSKDIALLIRVVAALREKGTNASLTLVGTPLTEADVAYRDELSRLVSELHLSDTVHFKGAVANIDLPQVLQGHDLLVNAYQNQSLDKVLLEAMAMGVIPVSSNASYCTMVHTEAGRYALPATLCVPQGDIHAFVESIRSVISLPEAERGRLQSALRTLVVEQHGIEGLIERIVSRYHSRV